VKKVFISDCEGPISKNDNAFEITSTFVPNGDRLFTVISRYDDVLAYVVKRSHHKAGDTLKLVLPFLKAYGVTDRKIHEFSVRNLLLIQNAKENLRHVRTIANVFIVSTSYEHYIKALCSALHFPYRNTYCTKLHLDRFHVCEKEEVPLKEIAQEIALMPRFEVPVDAESLTDFPEKTQIEIRRLDEIFWKEIIEMETGRIFSEINPVGGSEKARSVQDAVQRSGMKLADVMYVGDSITDDQAFRLVKENGGLAVSFNGNDYAVRSAELAVLSASGIVTAVIADSFCRFGKQETLSLAEKWNCRTLRESHLNRTLLSILFRLYPKELPKVKIITKENMETLARESSEFRKKVRGEAIGRLG
jgi:energy-converting hydrogenase A subunit R